MAILIYLFGSFLLVFAGSLFWTGVTQLGTEGAGDLVTAAATLAAGSIAGLAATQVTVTWREQRARQVVEAQAVKRREVYELVMREILRQFTGEERASLSEMRAAAAVWGSPALIKSLRNWNAIAYDHRGDLNDYQRGLLWAALFPVFEVIRAELAPPNEQIDEDTSLGFMFDDYSEVMSRLRKSGS